MFRYIVFRLLQFGGPDRVLLRAWRTTTSHRQKTAKVVDDGRLLRIVERVDGFVKGPQKGPDKGIETLRTSQMDRQRAPVVWEVRLDPGSWKKPSVIVMRAPSLVLEWNGWIHNQQVATLGHKFIAGVLEQGSLA